RLRSVRSTNARPRRSPMESAITHSHGSGPTQPLPNPHLIAPHAGAVLGFPGNFAVHAVFLTVTVSSARVETSIRIDAGTEKNLVRGTTCLRKSGQEHANSTPA